MPPQEEDERREREGVGRKGEALAELEAGSHQKKGEPGFVWGTDKGVGIISSLNLSPAKKLLSAL